MPNPNAPFHPIIYVRGYAMTRVEIDETTADPFCGFNLGSTTFRAALEKDKPAKKYVFESPVVRLRSDFDYTDVFENGLDIMDPGWTDSIPSKSIIIYRYYEQASNLLGSGKTPEIEEFGEGLGNLILRVRDLVCQDSKNNVSLRDFRCYLVAHSMGGLVCRAFLQNPKAGKDIARQCVDKVFTYATPHNGIEVAGINVPGWLSANDINNFNRARMSEYLNLKALYKKTERVDWVPEKAFPSERFFCMVGTNRADYEAAMGISRAFAGHGSDGLVGVDNASVWGIDAKGQTSAPCATAYAYRAHSGFFGIVNSEESYQNLIRFLFGDVRVNIWLDIDEIRLPKGVQQKANQGKEVSALYQFEILASPRGMLWYLTRRIAEEDSVACRRHKDVMNSADKDARRIYLSTVFLGKSWRVNPKRPSLAYSVTLGVRVPDYEVERKLWVDEHYEGGYLFRDSVVIELIPPQENGGEWQVTYDWRSDNLGQVSTPLDPKALKKGKVEISIPFQSGTTPGIDGNLRFVASAWNA
ncbi:MAG: esterase/lipase family protein [Nitrospiraceae bacterium]